MNIGSDIGAKYLSNARCRRIVSENNRSPQAWSFITEDVRGTSQQHVGHMWCSCWQARVRVTHTQIHTERPQLFTETGVKVKSVKIRWWQIWTCNSSKLQWQAKHPKPFVATGVLRQVYFLQSVKAISFYHSYFYHRDALHKFRWFLDDVTRCAGAAGSKEGKEHKITACRRLGLRPGALCTEWNRQNQDCRLQLIKIATEPHLHTYSHTHCSM